MAVMSVERITELCSERYQLFGQAMFANRDTFSYEEYQELSHGRIPDMEQLRCAQSLVERAQRMARDAKNFVEDGHFRVSSYATAGRRGKHSIYSAA